jgi:RNA polymerase sigma factor (sigma-70 family)
MDERKSLVLAAQHGDLDAFTLLVKQFQDMAFAVAYATLGDRRLAEDAAQESFLEAYLNLRKLQEPAAFPGWLRTIVVRQAHRLARGKQVAILPLDAAMEMPSPEPDPVTAMLVRELHDDLHTAIQMLPEHERQVAMLFYMSNCSQREIAEFLAVRVSTVKNRLFAARNHLRKRMIDMVQEDLQEQRPSNDDRFVTEVMEIIKATEQGDFAKIEALLAKRPALAKAKDPTAGATALHYASWTGQHEVADLLLAHGADIDLHDDKHDAPPIGWAGENGQQAMFDFLLAKGAKLNIRQAAAYGSLELVRSYLRDDPALVHFGTGAATQGWSPLWAAAYWRRQEILALLLAHGADVNARTRRKETALHGAVSGGDISLVQMLLDRGSDVNVQDESGRTPLHRAAWKRSADIVALLLQHKAEANCKDSYGHTPMHLASTKEGTAVDGWGEAKAPNPKIIQSLKEYGAT